MLRPSILNFWAGLLAGAGINLLTSAATADTTREARRLVVAALPWLVAALAQAWAATVSEARERDGALLITANHSAEERREILRATGRGRRLTYWCLTAVVGLAVVYAIVLVPGLLTAPGTGGSPDPTTTVGTHGPVPTGPGPKPGE